MRPNGKKFAVRVVLFVACAVGVLSTPGNAATASGTFKLPKEARWGMMDLAPGEYSFSVDTSGSGRTVTIRSLDSGWSGMVMSVSLSQAAAAKGSSLQLATSEEGFYVKTLNLGGVGYSLEFAAPKSGKPMQLVKSNPTAMASSSGSH